MKKLIIFQIFIIFILAITTVCGFINCKNYKRQICELSRKIEQMNSDYLVCKSTNKELRTKVKQLEVESLKNPIDIREQECISKDYSTTGMNNCAYVATNEWYQEINNNMSLLKRNMTVEQYKLLTDSQKKWQQYEQSQRALLGATIGTKVGSIYTNILAGINNQIVKRRAEDLFEIYDYYTDYSISTFLNEK